MDKKTKNTLNWVELGKLWSQYQIVTDNSLKDFSTNAKSPAYVSVIYQNLLQRIYFGVRTSEILLGLLHQGYFKFSIAIQLRSTVLDSMIATYLINFTEDEVQFKNQVANLSHQTAHNINREIEEKCRENSMSQENRNKLFETLSILFPGNFNKNEKNKFNSESFEPISASKIVESYCENPKTTDNEQKWMKECYKLYLHFSTYEHYNALSKTLLENEMAFYFDLNKFIYSTKFIFDASITCLSAMREKGNYIKQLEELKTKWDKLEPVPL